MNPKIIATVFFSINKPLTSKEFHRLLMKFGNRLEACRFEETIYPIRSFVSIVRKHCSREDSSQQSG
ncbi:hypothetical protein MKW98_001498 [Papaver atlanticum]|uniref:Uncharacterized protein n=1 Tax=Papaver atlanticum TaxID=357466 RepID=A0AAD4SYN5_9MAGN|nr:hypothetical protein MKW98_001498 [Papaver atlanticum]